MKISFVIPVYNVESYLHQCVDSILSQTYRDIEIILVDDGSPDKCPQICDEYAGKDSRVIALHKTNGGLSDARNYGLDNATGDYVTFVDSDDFWSENNSLDKLVTVLNKNPDLDFVGYNCRYFFQNDNKYSKWQLFPEVLTNPINNNTALVELSKNGYFAVSACMKLIKRQFLVDNHIYFKVGQLSEDIPWFINLIDSADKCMFTNDYVYTYRQITNGNSISHNIGTRNVDTIIEIINDEIKNLDNRSLNKEAKDALRSFMAYELILAYACLQYLEKEDAIVRYKRLQELNWLLSYTLNPKVKKVSLINKILGTRITAKVIQRYLNHVR